MMHAMNDRLNTATFEPAPAAETGLRSGAQALIDALVEADVEVIFGYPGGAVLPIYDALYADPRLRHVLVRHEQAAVHAAQGYARTTGKPGVVLVTSGPGMSNTTTGLLDALSDSVPVVCISGQVSSALIGSDAFQECDALGISRPVTKWNTQIRSVDAVRSNVLRAFAIATQGRPGPVLVDFPKDLQLALADRQDQPSRSAEGRATRRLGLPRAALRRAALLIGNAALAQTRPRARDLGVPFDGTPGAKQRHHGCRRCRGGRRHPHLG
jgi:acetolactate synthase-1/2/3 large subunit